MYVSVSASHNMVQDLSEIVGRGGVKSTPNVYFSLFETAHQITVLNGALNFLHIPISGVLLDESLVRLRSGEVYDKIIHTSKTCRHPVVSLEDIKKQEKVVVIVQNDAEYFPLIVHYFEQHQVKCYLFHYSEIKNSAVINGKIRVINRAGYLNEWPWFLDILLKDMPEDKRSGLSNSQIIGEVVSNGRYYHYADVETEYSRIKDGFRSTGNYIPLENQEKYTVTLLGDSRFVHPLLPTEMTIGAYLQKKFSENHLNCEVKNFSVHANDIQNQFAMLKSLNIGATDIIICTMGILKHADFRQHSLDTRIQIKVRVMRDMTEYCRERGAELLFVHLPHIRNIPNLTYIEQFIADSYNVKYEPEKIHETIKQYCMAQSVKVIDFTSVMIHAERTSLFYDATHCAPEGCKCIADTLYGYVQSIIKRNDLTTGKISKLAEQAYDAHRKYVVESRFKGVTEYVKQLGSIAKGKPERCGAIVMNCNPFTLGHRYLIEQAIAQVEHLYILVVEEDRSVFPYKDRFEMVRRGVADLPNVEVIPSGKFVISSLTFPEYFEKSEKQDEVVDATTDIEIFCTYIAPALHIKVRFVGEEPLDKVTNQYNVCMKKMLPEYGIDFIEIPRKKSGEDPISASRVRALLTEKKYSEIQALVPQTTYEFLRQHY